MIIWHRHYGEEVVEVIICDPKEAKCPACGSRKGELVGPKFAGLWLMNAPGDWQHALVRCTCCNNLYIWEWILEMTR